MTAKTHKFYILRHGETDANVSGRIQGSSDFSKLTENGKEQAISLGKALVNCKLEITNGVYVSPLSRARETLSLIRSIHDKFGRDETVLNDLREIDFYDWEGKLKDELIEEYPESWQAWEKGQAHNLWVIDKFNGNNENRYPLLELWTRAENVWKTIHRLEEEEYSKDRIDETKGNDKKIKTSILVCHGTLGQALLGTSLQEDSSFFGKHVIKNCEMVEIEWTLEEDKFNGKASNWKWFLRK